MATTYDSSLIRQAKEAIHRDLSKRYKKESEQILLRMATTLDPRFKHLSWMAEDEKNAVRDRLRQEARDIGQNASHGAFLSPV